MERPPDPATRERSDQPVVLVVDDDDLIRRLFATGLQRAGIQALTAADGREALEVLRSSSVDVVLLDSRMPVLDGFGTLQEIRADPLLSGLTVIFVTGGVEVTDRIRGLDAGADDYLQKPLHMDELVARVRAHLRGRTQWRRRLEDSLRRRTQVAHALGRVRLHGSAEETASAVCGCLRGLEGDVAAAVIAFGRDGPGTVLARSDRMLPDARAGDRLPRAVTDYLGDRARAGSWVERRDTQPPGAVGVPLASPDITAAAYMPLLSEGELFGLLAMGAVEGDDGDPLAWLLPAAMDLAPVIGALLAPKVAGRLEIEQRQQRVRDILTRQAFRPVFQPIIDLRTRQTVGFEALTRFQAGENTERTFTEAAHLGIGVELEAATAAAALAASADLPFDVWLSVNVSPAFLTATDVIRPLVAKSPRPLVLELTEHDPIDDYAAVLASMADLGTDLRLSVDDAGAGYACLHHILALQPAFVKLDRGWVSGIGSDPARQALVAGLEAFAVRTDCLLIAEGIEDASELATLTELRVRLGQGFFLGRPQEADSEDGGPSARPSASPGG